MKIHRVLLINLVSLVVYSVGFASGSAPIACLQDAAKRTNIFSGGALDPVQTAAILCSGAKSNAPVDCFLDAAKRTNINQFPGELSFKYLTTLCSGAESNAPTECFVAASKIRELKDMGVRNFSILVKLCSGAHSNAPIRCFANALDKNQTMIQSAYGSETKFNVAATLCTEKGITYDKFNF